MRHHITEPGLRDAVGQRAAEPARPVMEIVDSVVVARGPLAELAS